jgi:hypothetical protein
MLVALARRSLSGNAGGYAMTLTIAEKFAVLHIVVAVQWADLAYDTFDLCALGRIANELDLSLNERQLERLVYGNPGGHDATELDADPTRLGGEAAALAHIYCEQLARDRPTTARIEYVTILRELMQLEARVRRAAPTVAAPARSVARGWCHTTTSTAEHGAQVALATAAA